MDIKSKSYAVIFTYSFDYDVYVRLFETWDEAWKFLEDSYNEEIRIDREENHWWTSGIIDKEAGYAKITNMFCDEEDITEFRIGDVQN